MYFEVQEAFSALPSNMKKPTIFLLLFAAGLTLCSVVTASLGENRAAKVFYCKIPGCAANVTVVFCNDEALPSHSSITECAGPPPPNTVCQHDGRAFVSSVTDGGCEFEGKGGYIETEPCTDHSIICTFINQEKPEDQANHAYMHVVGGVCGSLLLIVLLVVGSLLFARFYKKRGTANIQQPASEPPREMQRLRETNDSDTRNGGPGLDGGS